MKLALHGLFTVSLLLFPSILRAEAAACESGETNVGSALTDSDGAAYSYNCDEAKASAAKHLAVNLAVHAQQCAAQKGTLRSAPVRYEPAEGCYQDLPEMHRVWARQDISCCVKDADMPSFAPLPVLETRDGVSFCASKGKVPAPGFYTGNSFGDVFSSLKGSSYDGDCGQKVTSAYFYYNQAKQKAQQACQDVNGSFSVIEYGRTGCAVSGADVPNSSVTYTGYAHCCVDTPMPRPLPALTCDAGYSPMRSKIVIGHSDVYKTCNENDVAAREKLATNMFNERQECDRRIAGAISKKGEIWSTREYCHDGDNSGSEMQQQTICCIKMSIMDTPTTNNPATVPAPALMPTGTNPQPSGPAPTSPTPAPTTPTNNYPSAMPGLPATMPAVAPAMPMSGMP